MDVHENPLNFFCLVTLSPSWQGMTINLNNTGLLLAERGEMHLQFFDDTIINVADWDWKGGQCQSMRKSAVVCAAAKGSRFAMHTACGSQMQREVMMHWVGQECQG